ncbi:MAG: hypothetical protein ACRCZ2_05265 [Fusobacteriaceae bacterium]
MFTAKKQTLAEYIKLAEEATNKEELDISINKAIDVMLRFVSSKALKERINRRHRLRGGTSRTRSKII